MKEQEKGIVYFFRHKGISPVKIGYSNKQDYRDRFNQFNMYSPYGAEMLGVIVTETPIELEKKLHLELSDKKTRGEFFDISLEKVNELICRYSDENQIEIMKQAALIVLKKIMPYDINREIPASSFPTELYNKEVILNLSEACKFFNVKKNEFKKFAEDNFITNKVYRVEGKYIRGFKLYIEK